MKATLQVVAVLAIVAVAILFVGGSIQTADAGYGCYGYGYSTYCAPVYNYCAPVYPVYNYCYPTHFVNPCYRIW